jgi:hypothetical protein
MLALTSGARRGSLRAATSATALLTHPLRSGGRVGYACAMPRQFSSALRRCRCGGHCASGSILGCTAPSAAAASMRQRCFSSEAGKLEPVGENPFGVKKVFKRSRSIVAYTPSPLITLASPQMQIQLPLLHRSRPPHTVTPSRAHQLVTSPFEIIVSDPAKVDAVLASAADSARIRSFSIIAHMYALPHHHASSPCIHTHTACFSILPRNT